MASTVTNTGPINSDCGVCLEDFGSQELNFRQEILFDCRHRLHTICAAKSREILLGRGCLYCETAVQAEQLPVQLTPTFREKMETAWAEGSHHGRVNCDGIIAKVALGSGVTVAIATSYPVAAAGSALLAAAPSYAAAAGAAGVAGTIAAFKRPTQCSDIVCATWVTWCGASFLNLALHDYDSKVLNPNAEAIHHHFTVAAVSASIGAIVCGVAGEARKGIAFIGDQVGEGLERVGGGLSRYRPVRAVVGGATGACFVVRGVVSHLFSRTD